MDPLLLLTDLILLTHLLLITLALACSPLLALSYLLRLTHLTSTVFVTRLLLLNPRASGKVVVVIGKAILSSGKVLPKTLRDLGFHESLILTSSSDKISIINFASSIEFILS